MSIKSVQLWGELTDASKTYSAMLNLTVRERWEGQTVVDRAVMRTELSPMSAMVVEDGQYALRYSFQGRTEEHSVRVESGVLLAAIPV